MAYRNLSGLSKQEVTQILTNFHDHHARQPIHQTAEAKQVLTPFLQDLEERMKAKGYCDRIEFTGSTYQGVKISNDVEFDLLFIINKRGSVVYQDIPKKVSYMKLKLKQGMPTSMINRAWVENGFISAKKVVELFEEALEECVNEMKKKSQCQVKLVSHGPGKQLDFERHGRVWFSVDLVPTIELDGRHEDEISRFVPKKIKKTKEWRIDYALKEKEEFHALDRGNKCHKYCLRILKALRWKFTNMHYLPTYYFKTVLLHVIKERKDLNWEQENMADRMLDLLEYVERTLFAGTIPEIDIPGAHLLEKFKKESLDNTAGQVHNILTNKRNKFRKSFAM